MVYYAIPTVTPTEARCFMITETVTLHLPEPLYRRIQRTAQIMRQPIEDFLLDAVTTALPLLDDLPPELVNDVATLTILNDAALWRSARQTMSQSHQERMEFLMHTREGDALSLKEQRELDELLHEYERIVTIRAQAAVLLQQRGYDVSAPVTLNESSVDCNESLLYS